MKKFMRCGLVIKLCHNSGSFNLAFPTLIVKPKDSVAGKNEKMHIKEERTAVESAKDIFCRSIFMII